MQPPDTTSPLSPWSDGETANEIFVPEPLLAAAASSEARPQTPRWSSTPLPPTAVPADEIHVQKRRRSWVLRPAEGSGGVYRHVSDSSAVEEGRGSLSPLCEEAGSLYHPQSLSERSATGLRPQRQSRYGPPTIDGEPRPYPHSRGLSGDSIFAAPMHISRAPNSVSKSRNGSLRSLYDRAKLVDIKHQRQDWLRYVIEYGAYTFLILVVYFVLVGFPLWKGAVYWLYWTMQHKLVFQGGWAIFTCMLVWFSYSPLLIQFEPDPPGPEYYQVRHIAPEPPSAALVIPCYLSGSIIGRTLEAALHIFPASHIYVIANGNSATPLDNTEEICQRLGVNHIWCPVGSKIVALFVGCYAAKAFRYVLLIDDDCILPPNFPVVTRRLTGAVQCIGYTIKSVGRDSSPGTYCQQAQDLEYKLAGLQRSFAGRVGSATFPHGAISLWRRKFLKLTLEKHPGFSISEDWFLGDSCRRLGGRIQMCSAVFVETTTPARLISMHADPTRGGFGETTVCKQRFLRWNFFVTHSMWYNLSYLFGSWRLRWWDVGTKLFVFQELYETALYMLTPFIIPVSLVVEPGFTVLLTLATWGLYLLNALIFNEVHLKRKDERVDPWVVAIYYMPYKLMIGIMNVISCYWSIIKYARYFARRHPKLTEDHKAVGMVLRLEELSQREELGESREGGMGRSLTVRSVGYWTGTGPMLEIPELATAHELGH
ncbi:glycosyltransferase like family 2-domain-containing protein [Aspergillus granulosus]|uniref:Glycosyltransferase like family 2-domain-containing protein n=1 Tax=Aspergillus granulosus TaxID=176169 RepID=A0ABR4GW46_9EURO